MGSRGRVPTSEVGVNIWNKGPTHPMYDCDNERILRTVSIFAPLSSRRALFFKHNLNWTIGNVFSPNVKIHWREKHRERGPTKETQNFLLVLCRHASSRSRLAFQDFRKIREYPLLGFHPPLTIISLSTWETAHMGRILNGERARNRTLCAWITVCNRRWIPRYNTAVSMLSIASMKDPRNQWTLSKCNCRLL